MTRGQLSQWGILFPWSWRPLNPEGSPHPAITHTLEEKGEATLPLTPAPKTALWWKPKQRSLEPQSPLHISQSTGRSQSSLPVSVGTQWLPSRLGTHTEISTTNIQQLNKNMDTPCTMQKIFVLLMCFQMM